MWCQECHGSARIGSWRWVLVFFDECKVAPPWMIISFPGAYTQYTDGGSIVHEFVYARCVWVWGVRVGFAFQHHVVRFVLVVVFYEWKVDPPSMSRGVIAIRTHRGYMYIYKIYRRWVHFSRIIACSFCVSAKCPRRIMAVIGRLMYIKWTHRREEYGWRCIYGIYRRWVHFSWNLLCSLCVYRKA